MANSGSIVQSGYSRVWLLRRGAGPGTSPEFLACVKAGDPSWSLGDITKIECPDPATPGKFVTVDEIRGARDNVTLSLMGRYSFDASTLLEIAREGCKGDYQVHIGKCKDMRDYKGGWQKILVFPDGYLTSYSLENLGAIESGEQNPTNENADLSASEMYEIMPISFAELCASTVARELVSISVCDSANCGGDCGDYSDGCSKVFAIQLGTGATPGTLPSVVYTDDGFLTCASDDISTMFSNETPTGSACVAGDLVVIAATSNSLHYKDVDDILAGTSGNWAETTDGFSGVSPRAISSADSRHTWIVGDSGYIWFTEDPTVSVTAQSAGSVTTQALYTVHALDSNNVLAGGAANALVVTDNGGDVWSTVSAPAALAGVQINAVLMLSANVWYIGYNNGDLYYTLDAGSNWTEISLPGSLTQINDIKAATNSVVYLTGVATNAGKILRSTAGGAAGTWYVMPESGATIPANDRVNELAVCAGNPNVVYGAGLGDDASDGFLVKAA